MAEKRNGYRQNPESYKASHKKYMSTHTSVKVVMDNESKDELKSYLEEKGESMSSFFIRAAAYMMALEKSQAAGNVENPSSDPASPGESN